MPTITLTKENFGKKVSLLYDKIITTGKVRITLEETDNRKELIWTQYEETSLGKAMKDLKSGKTVKINLNAIKTEDDFISFIKS